MIRGTARAQTLLAIAGQLFLDRPGQNRTMQRLCRSDEAAMEVAVERHGEQKPPGGKGDSHMKKIFFSVVAAFALTLTSAAYAQSTPSTDKAPPPPPSDSTGSDSTGSPSPGTQTGKTDTAKKTGKNKQGSSDSSSDKAGSTKY
jgi:hypothetical protein